MVSLILASKGRITNPFGALNPPTAALKYHQGVDTGHGSGLDVFAPAAGQATQHDAGTRLGTYGKYWRVRHDDGTESLVAHLARHVGGNRRVEQGEVIGVMGNTGTIAVHCHQEYIVNGVRVDPTKYLGGTAGGGATPIPPDEEEDEDMAAEKIRMIHEITADGKVGRRAMLKPGTPWFVPWTEGGATYANRFASEEAFDTGSSIEVTTSLFNQFANAAKASGDLPD